MQYSAIEFIRFSCFSVTEILRVSVKSSYLQTDYWEGMYCLRFKLSCWEQTLILIFLIFFAFCVEYCRNAVSCSITCFQNVICFHLCFMKHIKYSSLFMLYKSLEIISFFFFFSQCQVFLQEYKEKTEDLFYFSKRKSEYELSHAWAVILCIAFCMLGPHQVSLRHQVLSYAELGFRNSAKRWSARGQQVQRENTSYFISNSAQLCFTATL